VIGVFIASAAKAWADRTEEELTLISAWMDRLSWYELFRRTGLPPAFDEPSVKSMRV